MVIKAVLSDECNSAEGQRVIVAPHTGGSLALAVASRDWGGSPPVMLAYEEMDRVQEFSPTSCVVYRLEGAPPSEADFMRLATLGGLATPVYDDSGKQPVFLVK